MTITLGDCYAVLDPALTQDGHHGPAFEQFFRDLCGSSWQDDPTQHRYGQKTGIIPPSTLVAPPPGWLPSHPGGVYAQSIEHLRVEDHSTIVAQGPMPAGLWIDGCALGWWKNARIEARRSHGGGRYDVPFRNIQISKSLPTHASPRASHFLLDKPMVWGPIIDSPIALGSPQSTGIQEDHNTVRDGWALGVANIQEDDTIDLCQSGYLGGNTDWSNNRRNLFDNCWISGYGFAFGSYRGGARFVNCNADGCRDVYWFAGSQNKATVIGGEAENCQRLVADALLHNYDCSLTFRDFTAKLDLWRPDLPPPQSVSDLVYREEFRGHESLGWWGTRGGLLLDNVTVSHLPIERATPTSSLRYVHDSSVPAPRLHVVKPYTLISTRCSSAFGYRSGRAFTRVIAGGARHELWGRTHESGECEGTVMAADNVYAA